MIVMLMQMIAFKLTFLKLSPLSDTIHVPEGMVVCLRHHRHHHHHHYSPLLLRMVAVEQTEHFLKQMSVKH